MDIKSLIIIVLIFVVMEYLLIMNNVMMAIQLIKTDVINIVKLKTDTFANKNVYKLIILKFNY